MNESPKSAILASLSVKNFLPPPHHQDQSHKTALAGVVVYVAKKLSSSCREVREVVESMGGEVLQQYQDRVTHMVFQVQTDCAWQDRALPFFVLSWEFKIWIGKRLEWK